MVYPLWQNIPYSGSPMAKNPLYPLWQNIPYGRSPEGDSKVLAGSVVRRDPYSSS